MLYGKVIHTHTYVYIYISGEDSGESLGLQGDPTSPFWRRSALGFLWREWCWSWNSSTLATSCEELTHWKDRCWEGLGAGGEGMTEDEMAGWHHRLNGRESECTPGVGDGRGGLACCDSWGHKESDTTERLNWTELNWMAENEEVLKSFLMKVKKESKHADLKLNI